MLILHLTWNDSPNPNIPYANINSPEAIANTSPDGSLSLHSPCSGDSYTEGACIQSQISGLHGTAIGALISRCPDYRLIGPYMVL